MFVERPAATDYINKDVTPKICYPILLEKKIFGHVSSSLMEECVSEEKKIAYLAPCYHSVVADVITVQDDVMAFQTFTYSQYFVSTLTMLNSTRSHIW